MQKGDGRTRNWHCRLPCYKSCNRNEATSSAMRDIQDLKETGESYTLKTAQETAENNRLNEVHFAFKEYLGNKICLAPIYGTAPKKILELGCGSGAWAIDAATDFPDAQVLAVDLSPIPENIPLPKNMNFETLDVTKDFPFEEQSFDIVHARLLLMHVPGSQVVLERAAKLVKPGGWLVLEDLDMQSMMESGGPVVKEVIRIWRNILNSRGADGDIGRKMKSIIEASGTFTEISAQKIAIPICNDGSAPKNLTRLGEVFKATVKKLVDDWAERFSAEGINKDIAEKYKNEVDMNLRQVEVDMHFVCAQRTFN
ncbi:S-adenosyl-L-methionine-dependent methyltransferase [Mycena galericulata]|nr:S-adenosyl-L-methionine-dependent methyltransferase [Mycena galericulata]